MPVVFRNKLLIQAKIPSIYVSSFYCDFSPFPFFSEFSWHCVIIEINIYLLSSIIKLGNGSETGCANDQTCFHCVFSISYLNCYCFVINMQKHGAKWPGKSHVIHVWWQNYLLTVNQFALNDKFVCSSSPNFIFSQLSPLCSGMRGTRDDSYPSLTWNLILNLTLVKPYKLKRSSECQWSCFAWTCISGL